MAEPVSSQTIDSKPSSFAAYLAICLCFCLSGLAALIYQTAWTRQFALVFGTSELAVATVLAAYMAGLALGARGIEYFLPRIVRPIRVYAALEIGIAVAALVLVPVCLWASQHLLVALLGNQSEPPSSAQTATSIFYLVAAFAALIVPTTLMGATLPILARDGVHVEQQIGKRIGALYACNTAGAVLGALLGALLLLPRLGLQGTVWVAAVVNVLVALLALGVLRMNRAPAAPALQESPHFRPHGWRSPFWVLPLMLLSGAVSFMHEVLWTRMLQHEVGSSIYAFGVMVASFLLGIALGGAGGAWLARQREAAARWLALSQIGTAAGAVFAWYALTHWTQSTAPLWSKVGFGLLVLLPLACAIGFTYPLAVRVLANNVEDAPAASARVYSWNTVGAIVGALAGGFWLIPALRYEGAVQLAVDASLALAVLATLMLVRVSVRFIAPVGVCALAGALLFQPQVPDKLLRTSPLRTAEGELVYYSVGRTADVVVLHNDVSFDLRTNGLPEAGADVRGATPTLNVEAWMSPFAVLARPDTASMLVVGFGGGNVVQAIPPSVRSIDVIELEPDVIAANRAIAAQRRVNPLADSRVNLILNDARGSLSLTDKHYDAIVSQPSHPWTAGASHLYTREFMAQAHAHLNPGGVFVQWMGTDFVNEGLLRSLTATFLNEFAEVRVYRPSPTTLLFMGSDKAIEPERSPQRIRAALDRSPTHYSRQGINVAEDMVAALALDTENAKAFAANSSIITDDNNQLATSGVFDLRRAISPAAAGELLAPYDPLGRSDSFVYRELGQQLSFDYIWRRIAVWVTVDGSALERMSRIADILGNSERSLYLRVAMAMRLNQPALAQDLLRQGLALWPDSQLLRYQAMDISLGTGNASPSAPSINAIADGLSGEPAMVLSATRLATDQRWSDVAALDDRLAQVAWTAPWATQAAQMRAEWRARVGNAELRPRYGEEGIAIADRILVSQPDTLWQALRAFSAVGTDRPEIILESIAAFTNGAMEAVTKFTPNERQIAKERAQNLAALLDKVSDDKRLNAQRVGEVRQKLQSLRNQLG